MNIKALIAGGLLLGGAYYLSTRKTLAKATKFTFEKIGLDTKKKKIVVTLGILNPSNHSSTIKSLVGSLFFSNKEVATITSFDKTPIVPNGKTLLKVYLSPSVTGILTVAKNLIATKGKDFKKLNASFKGNANVDDFTFPIDSTLG